MAQKNKQVNKQRHCWFCVNKVQEIDYKETGTLRRYVSSFGKIVPRKRNGVCSWHQRDLANAIKRARIMALLPFVQK